jgi:putative ABC transport system permease protein
MSAIASNISQSHPDTNRDICAQVVSLHEKVTAQARPGLLIVWVAAGIVLLIACANVAHLFLVRTMSRRREVAIRLAVGATPGRIVRLLVTESALVVFVGGLLGTGLAGLILPMLRTFSATLPRVDQAGLAPVVWLYTLAAAAVATLLISIPSFLEVRRSDINQVIKQGNLQLFSNRGSRLGSILMVSEIALGFMTLAIALLLVRSFASLLDVKPGFNGTNVLAVNVSLSARGRGWGPTAQIFETRLQPEIASLPGVQAVAGVNAAPMSLQRSQISRFSTRFNIPGANFDPDSYPTAQIRWISQDYFQALDIPILKGEPLKQTDREKPRYLINENLANRFFPGQDPVGKQLLLVAGEGQPRPVEIVGVVGNVRDLGLDFEVQPTIYAIATPPEVTLLVRSEDVNSPALAASIKEVIRRSDPNAPITGFRTVEQAVSQSLERPRIALRLMVGFAILTAVLLVVGVYGVIASMVSRSKRDFGIRMALGARPSQLVWLVLRRGLIVSLVGLGVGLALSWISSRLMMRVLFQISPTDPFTLAGAGVLLIALCALSMLLPARRAALTDPAITLKSE